MAVAAGRVHCCCCLQPVELCWGQGVGPQVLHSLRAHLYCLHLPCRDLEDQLKAKEQQLQQLRLLSQSRKRSDDGEVVITTKRGSSKAAMYMPYEPEPERWGSAARHN